MEVFRLAGKKYSKILTGAGAAINGARWNSKGIEIIYTSQNRALTIAELLVHYTAAIIPENFELITMMIPDEIEFQEIKLNELPDDWNIFPNNYETKKIGDKFITENKYCLLKVPSVVVKGEYNILINPAHMHFKKIYKKRTEKFKIDNR
ncbi:MAG TPA: RES family NAD+ phosphorylase [Ignavibacteria bacterium]|nr:RES family NAD+ phosphorylase [Ignavibacteria bacterium]